MNKSELIQFGEFIYKNAMQKQAQSLANNPWLRMGAGALLGGFTGGAVQNAWAPGNSSNGTQGAALGALGGAITGALSGNTPTLNRGLYNWSKGIGQYATPIVGAIGGGYLGSRAADAAGADNWASKGLGIAGGAVLGGMAGHGLNSAMGRAGEAGMRRYITDNYADNLSGAIRRNMNNSGGLLADIAENDPNRMFSIAMTANHIGDIDADQLGNVISALDRHAASGSANAIQGLAGDATRGLTGNRAANLANSLGIEMPSQQNIFSQFARNQLGQNWKQDYLNPALMLGGAYVGANAIGDVYNKFQGNNNKNRNGTVIVA